MLEFQLFRIRVFLSPQRYLYAEEPTRQQMLREAIESLPSGEFRRGLIWHIGNVTPIDEKALYFRVGRRSKEKLEIFDERDGRFEDQEFQTAPYTHAIVDVELELCAIAKKTRLSPTTTGIARQLGRLLKESKKAAEFEADFDIDEVKDPEDFIDHLRSAYSISKFWVTFSRPNAWDTDRDFIKPMQQCVEAANGKKGKAELKGDNLDTEILEKITRSAAATGDDAGASLKLGQGQKEIRKQLRGSLVSISREDVADHHQRFTLLIRMRELYRKVRGNGI